jgi:chaperone modulatory protein CbpM
MVGEAQVQSAPSDGRVMLSATEFRRRAGIDALTLTAWVEAEWLRPRPGEGCGLGEIDVARALLIRTLGEDMSVNAEGIGVVLDLVDQIHGLRSVLDAFASTFRMQPLRIRERFLADARRLRRAEHRPSARRTLLPR